MRIEREVKVDSTIISRVNAARMSESERQVAISAMRNAEVVVDAFVWVAKKIEQLSDRLFLKPALRH